MLGKIFPGKNCGGRIVGEELYGSQKVDKDFFLQCINKPCKPELFMAPNENKRLSVSSQKKIKINLVNI